MRTMFIAVRGLCNECVRAYTYYNENSLAITTVHNKHELKRYHQFIQLFKYYSYEHIKKRYMNTKLNHVGFIRYNIHITHQTFVWDNCVTELDTAVILPDFKTSSFSCNLLLIVYTYCSITLNVQLNRFCKCTVVLLACLPVYCWADRVFSVVVLFLRYANHAVAICQN